MRRVIVTGGSRGLGLSIVERLVCDGYHVVAVGRRIYGGLVSAIDRAARTRPGSLRFVPFDLGDVPAIPALVKELRRENATIYGLVNNAAIGSEGALALMANAQIEHLIRVNTLSSITLTQYIVRHMMADGLLGARSKNITGAVLAVDAGATA